jgi:uncharacterized membrane protein
METKEESKNKYFYVCCFFIYCVIGWLYEVAWEFKVGNGFVNRGFLHGCYLPIYGFGALLLIFSLSKLMKKKIKIWKINITPIIVFLAILFLVSTVEFIASWGMELLFGKRWWDYSYDKFNLNGRISLRNSTLLALGGMLFVYVIQPILDKLFSKIKPELLKEIAMLIIIVMAIDFGTVITGYIV